MDSISSGPRRLLKGGLFFSAVAILLGLWAIGVFDEVLAPLGLNVGDCSTDQVTGATFCGDVAESFETP